MPYASRQLKREADRERRRAQTAAKQDIAERLGQVRDAQRRRRGTRSLKSFALDYFPERFDRPFSADHLEVIRQFERAVREGGKLIIVMPRGSGKTTLVVVCCLWAILIGARVFVVLAGSSKAAAVELLDSVKVELEANDRLADDFPLEVGPFRVLQGEARRAKGQSYRGQRTHIAWTCDTVVFASIPKSKASGSVIRVAGLTGRLRGMQWTRPDGSVIRPDFCIADDPQTDESATSASQTAYRERVLVRAVRGLAGPGKTISMLMPATVIARDDLTDRFFDKRRHPEWDGVRQKLLYSFPEKMDLWEEYARIYRLDRERGGDGAAALDFYRLRRKAMDRGARPAWEARFEPPKEISAIQNAMNLALFSRSAFLAEYQNEPEEEILQTGRMLAASVLEKLNGRPRGQVPKKSRWLVGHVDVHDEILYWHVLAVDPDFRAATIDYGTFPEQPERYFEQRAPRLPLSKKFAGKSKEGVISSGLAELLGRHLLPRRWPREDGAGMALDQLAVDAGYKPTEIAAVIRALGQGSRVLPSRGLPIGPHKKPLTEYRPEKGVIIGRHWRKGVTKATGLITIEPDTNRWKSFTRDRVLTAAGDSAAWTIFGTDPRGHQLFADHLAAERPTEVAGPWGKMEVWEPLPSSPDNHWLDNLVTSYVLAAAQPDGPKLIEWGKGEGGRGKAEGGQEEQPARRQAVSYL